MGEWSEGLDVTLAELEEGTGMGAGLRRVTGCEREWEDDAAKGCRELGAQEAGMSVAGVGDVEFMRTCGPYGSTSLRTCAATDIANTSLSIPERQSVIFFPLDGGVSTGGLSLSV